MHNNGTLSIIDSIITNNKGGISNDPTPEMMDNVVTNNTGGNPDNGDIGRGNVINGNGILTLRNCTISNNSPGLYSNFAILNISGTVVITNSTISGNRGNAAINNAWGTMSLNSTTVTNNENGLKNWAGELRLHNNILAGNHEFDCSNNEASMDAPPGTVTSLGYNLLVSSINCPRVESDLTGDPVLQILQSNGGPTPTHALSPTSPVINAGDPAGCTDEAGTPLLSDQRNAARDQ